MSGVGEALAIVGVVAGLIQAIDAGQNIVNRIKQRRLAHRANGALPPSDQLEQTLADGRRDIQQLVEKGKRRFGDDFVVDETARMAIMEVTIQIQNALLVRLTEARADDDVIDFDECIDLSDQACNDALVALQELYKRKLDEDLLQKRRQKDAIAQQESRPEPTIIPTHNASRGPSPQQLTPPPSRGEDSQSHSSSLAQAPAENPTPVLAKRSKTTPFGLFRRNRQPSDANTPSPPIERLNSAPSAVPAQRRGTVTMAGDLMPKQCDRAPSTSNAPQQVPMKPQKQPEAEDSWKAEMSRASTVRTTRASTINSDNSIMTSTLSKYNGSCKYAYRLREQGLKGSLDPINPWLHIQDWQFQCASNKCRFKIGAAANGKSQQFDSKVYVRYGVSYRKSLLAKSHVAHHKASDEYPYLCLLCVFLSRDSQIYNSVDSLLEHISHHDEPEIGPDNVAMTGPLVFGATSVKAEEAFDVKISSPASPKPLTPTLVAETRTAATQLCEAVEQDMKSSSKAAMVAQMRPTERIVPRVVADDSHNDPFHNGWVDMDIRTPTGFFRNAHT